ncbi:triose-phosphate isomerase [Patescibacteria group bacterium]|nr:triose-phosphate isomerase [Patescibacteria group bacterium]MBU2579784.1 triose-phosphate isomerase [Patescibacteria group bacterium]
MSKEPLIIANWKCNPASKKEAEHLFGVLKKELRRIKKTEVVICPPFIFSSLFPARCSLKLGGQNCFWENRGAFTGEVSPLMLKNLGCEFVIIGHSERKKYFQESDLIINKKLKAVLKNRLQPILCVGEEARDAFTAEGKPLNEMSLVVGEQVEKGLSGISSSRLGEIVIAYEPVWAIGTGMPCLPNDAMKAALLIRKTLTNLYSRNIAEKVRIIYGGSVNSQNASDYTKGAAMNGLLIGGASLNASEFVKIVKDVEEIL